MPSRKKLQVQSSVMRNWKRNEVVASHQSPQNCWQCYELLSRDYHEPCNFWQLPYKSLARASSSVPLFSTGCNTSLFNLMFKFQRSSFLVSFISEWFWFLYNLSWKDKWGLRLVTEGHEIAGCLSGSQRRRTSSNHNHTSSATSRLSLSWIIFIFYF